MTPKNAYSGEQIVVLEGLEPVRKRPAMYIGSTSLAGVHHCLNEIIDNSIDEALAGHCTAIEVCIHQNESISVADNGRGIPVGRANGRRKASPREVCCQERGDLPCSWSNPWSIHTIPDQLAVGFVQIPRIHPT